MIKKDCLRWSSEVDRAMPTVIFTAKDPAGQDMVDVRVFVDGQKVADRIDGRPAALDPGPPRHQRQLRVQGTAARVTQAPARTAPAGRRFPAWPARCRHGA